MNADYYYNQFISIETIQSSALKQLAFGDPVKYVYNPLEYASEPHQLYLKKYCKGTKKVLFIGMNPGPYGMAQTGVPFGEVELVRDWLGINGAVSQPDPQHPKRPILGFNCHRREVWCESKLVFCSSTYNNGWCFGKSPL
ncbi:SMUG1 [Cordylochernes scorpioides]|uniref:SMUG1 n=1 Tax=Cordylochernes scorpioides TaxID=51811 RepID=A0ABY6KK92_9ARAC|nr:SMUG1 [Cordylochernes scorpioides]